MNNSYERNAMNRRRNLLIASAIGVAVVCQLQIAWSDPGQSATQQMVRGDVLDVEGEHYVIKDISGHEIRLHVNKDTRMEERIKVGDRIEARTNSEGHADSIRVRLPDELPSKGSLP